MTARASALAPVAAALLLLCVGAAMAQSPFAGAAPAPQPFGGGWFDRVYQAQAELHRALTGAVRALKAGEPQALSLLLGLGFVYGVVHAAGPGHGKAVLSAYLLANPASLRLGALLSFAAAFVQALSALVLVSLLVLILNGTGRQIADWAQLLEKLSYACVAALGAWLAYSSLKALLGWRRAGAAEAPAHSHSHGDGHSGEHGHSHAVTPAALAQATTWRQRLALVVSIGLRPCSGAIIVLVFAFSQRLAFAGVGTVLAMALGTGITVAMLALLAVAARGLVQRFAAGRGLAAGYLVGLLLGLFVASLGTMLLLAPTRPLI